ncbi:MAG: hypothetical protein ACRCU0_00275 [Candidatus Rhabdochlamydia sp.]
MLKWCNPVHKKMAFTAKDTQLLPSCKKNQKKNHGHTYEPLDSSFRKKVDAVAWIYFSQQKFYKKPRDPSIFYPQELEKESILETMQISTWKKSVKMVLQDLTSRNSLLIEENKKKNAEIISSLNKLEEIKKENSSMIHEIINLTLLEPSYIDDNIESHVLIRPKNYREEDNATLIRQVSLESGYGSEKESEVTSRSSSSSSLGIIEENSDTLLELSIHQKLVEKNKNCKIKINAEEERFSPYLAAKNELLALQELSFQRMALIEKNKEQEERICLLEIRIAEAKEDLFDLEENNKALHKTSLLKEIHQQQFLTQIEIWEENIHQEQIELNSLENSFKKGSTLNTNIETFTKCLEQTTKLLSLLKNDNLKTKAGNSPCS